MTKLNPSAKDEADYASEEEDHAREEALWKLKHTGPRKLIGRCYNCDESCDTLFCDVGCQGDYERRKELERRTHGEAGRPLLQLPARKQEERARSDHHRDEYNTFERENDLRERKAERERREL